MRYQQERDHANGSLETIADATTPLTMKWCSDIYIDFPAGR
jgi:hypothetical protein